MNLKELRSEANKRLAYFVDKIGLDGETYTAENHYPMLWGYPKMNSLGEFVTPMTERAEEIVKEYPELDEKEKQEMLEKGAIIINKDQSPSDMLTTVIHEIIHSKRNLTLWDVAYQEKKEKDENAQEKEEKDENGQEKKEKEEDAQEIEENDENAQGKKAKNQNAYIFNNGKYEQITYEGRITYADASQEILKGNIDTSMKAGEFYKDKTPKEIKDMQMSDDKMYNKMDNQVTIDEALVEMMTLTACKLYQNKEREKSTDIWDMIKDVEKSFEGDDIEIICKIMLKHHDLELFKWMIDPIEYSYGDIHYDFFEKYTEGDEELVSQIYDLEPTNPDLQLQEYFEGLKIGMGDIRKIAESPAAIQEATICARDIKRAEKDKFER